MGRALLQKKYIWFIILGAIVVAILCLVLSPREKNVSKTVVTIAVLQDDLVQNFNTNYYTNWLEEKTGYDIEFEYISDNYEVEYLNTMLLAKDGRVDAVFLPRGKDILSMEQFEDYTRRGMIYDLATLSDENSYIHEYYREKSGESIYYMPNVDTSRKNENMQIMWINVSWLKQLGLKLPETEEELEKVLIAFQNQDPNGNGIRDELPLISSNQEESFQSYYFLLNAFAYSDSHYHRVDEADTAADMREGLQYCSRLYEEGLLVDLGDELSKRQLQELVNSPENLVGAFTSQSIADVVYPNCSDILARYVQVAPLRGPKGESHAVHVDIESHIGGYIPANAQHPKEAFDIMDLMLSEEAELIAAFGEENIDWKKSDSGDLSTYGNAALITTLHYLNDTVQNQNFAGAGPYALASQYANGVTWNGNNSLVEYIDARALKSYESYYEPSENLVLNSQEGRSYMQKCVRDFIVGKKDIHDDATWEGYLCEKNHLSNH